MVFIAVMSLLISDDQCVQFLVVTFFIISSPINNFNEIERSTLTQVQRISVHFG